ncbi:hypothetical protein HNQ93_004181 [Hymenobacter luteus]|uniref:DUF2269 domain-containing protein n=2 Tax=Hymenobacter TaxID=89966 RepID=A0A7W9T479_9BACT|nr:MULTISPECIES: hypothetical protein [Hymenobacter]MBB4603525.1 hypothetical protein [Hymenobacter latericoloratus]MBB6061302.1 hypothetical protein [Hymenobacter luteus]UYZ61335.1 hypothetical protein OIS50_20395 [Hymenobacter sp. YIM 151858-1]
MAFSPPLRKFVLTAHITFSVGWLGAVAAFLALAIAGLTSQDPLLVRASYLSMGLSGWFVIVPASMGALATGVVQALGTPWGLFKHYWVLVKLVLTAGATLLLLLHMQPVTYLADVAARTDLSATDLRSLRLQLLADAAAALAVLLSATLISVYKPWGRIEQWRKHRQQRVAPGLPAEAGPTPWGRNLLLALLVLGLLLVIGKHLLSGGMGHH